MLSLKRYSIDDLVVMVASIATDNPTLALAHANLSRGLCGAALDGSDVRYHPNLRRLHSDVMLLTYKRLTY